MRLFFSLLLLASTCTLASAPPPAEQDALALAIQSQRTLNEFSAAAAEPEAMKYAQRLKSTQTALDTRRKQWPSITAGPDPWDPFRACKNALEKASHVAGLSGMKAVSTLDEQVFKSEKSKLLELRSECDKQIRQRSGKAG